MPTSQPAPGAAVTPGAAESTQSSGAGATAKGEDIFLNNCARCHQSNGQGVQGAFPALAGNALVNNADPTQMIHIVLNGMGAMPSWKDALTDQELAAVISYVRSAWGNNAPPVTPDQVKSQR